MTTPFGTMAPTPAQERWRARSHRLPPDWFGRKAASLLLTLAGGRARRAYDVAVFGSQKARLHPYDNICEKRVYLTPQFWETEERAALAGAIGAHRERTFNFVDIGANVGLYTLFARAECGKAGIALSALCIEPDPEMQERLCFNVEASGAKSEVNLFRCAASDRNHVVRFAVDRASRGLSRIDPQGEMALPARPLLSMIEEAGMLRIDALKIDVEGHEFPVLDAFLRDAPPTLRPSLVILEHNQRRDQPASGLLMRLGYVCTVTTWRNSVFVLKNP